MRMNHGCLTATAIPVLIACVFWAAVELHIFFYDSEGNFRSRSLLGIAYAGVIAFAPLLVCAWSLFIAWKKAGPKS
jgi:hypothetical protein